MAPQPPAALLCAAILCFTAACLASPTAALAALAAGFAFLFLFRKSFKKFWRRFLAVNIFLLFMWLIVPWTSGGPALFSVGVFSASARGVEACLLATIKANAILAFFTAFLGGATPRDIGKAMAALRVPAKLAWIFTLMDCNLHNLREQWASLKTAADLKGFKPGFNLRSYRAIAALLAVFLLDAAVQARRLNEALALRGGLGALPFPAGPVAAPADFPALFAALGAAAALLFLNFYPLWPALF